MGLQTALLCTLVLIAGHRVAAAGTWEDLPELPAELGEVTAGLLTNEEGDTVLVVIGEGDPGTYLYNTRTQEWTSGAERPFLGNHIGGEVANNELYLFGGLRQGGDALQIYSLAADEWRAGAALPYEVGSAATALINGTVYLCGGILAEIDDTINQCIKYDVEADAWSADVAPMPEGVNHAASATDGTLLYVAGGRKGPNRVGPSYDFLQIYDPATNTWELGPPMPEARGGMGKAVVWGGEMFVIGGESDQNGPDEEIGLTSSNVFDRVEALNLTSLEWRLDTPMPLPRHGIFPVVDAEGSVYVAAGGVRRGNSQSTANTVLRLE